MKRSVAGSVFAFVLEMGMVNLFADMSYEGGASINGPFLGTLGASAAAVSIIAGDGKVLSVGSGVKRRTVPRQGRQANLQRQNAKMGEVKMFLVMEGAQ